MSSPAVAPVLEQILFTHPSLDLYRIPPRHGAQGYKSGEWRVDARIFTARVTVVAVGDATEVRLTDPATGESFGVVPIPPGQRSVAVEPAADSSRNFVLRLVDPASSRAAFVGASFADRGAAFDFSVAIADWEKRAEREREIVAIQNASDPLEAAKKILPEAATLFEHRDLRLKEGQKIAFSAKLAGPKGDGAGRGTKGGFLARLKEQQAANASSGAGAGAGAAWGAVGKDASNGVPAPATFSGLAAPPETSAAAPAFHVPPSEKAPAPPAPAAPAQDSDWGAAAFSDDAWGSLAQAPPATQASAAAGNGAAAGASDSAPTGWATFE